MTSNKEVSLMISSGGGKRGGHWTNLLPMKRANMRILEKKSVSQGEMKKRGHSTPLPVKRKENGENKCLITWPFKRRREGQFKGKK